MKILQETAKLEEVLNKLQDHKIPTVIKKTKKNSQIENNCGHAKICDEK